MGVTNVFLDVDGVLLDPDRTHREWCRLLGHVLAPALGGEPDDWGRANAQVFPDVFADRDAWRSDDPLVSERNLDLRFLTGMCRALGRPVPPDDEAVALYRRAGEYVCRNADCAFDGTLPVLRELASRYDVHLATGNPSWRMIPLLEQWGARDLIGEPTGPDLVGVMKDAANFHSTVFARAGVDAASSVVVDDDPRQVRRARGHGARGVLVAPEPPADGQADAVIANIASLPDALRRI